MVQLRRPGDGLCLNPRRAGHGAGRRATAPTSAPSLASRWRFLPYRLSRSPTSKEIVARRRAESVLIRKLFERVDAKPQTPSSSSTGPGSTGFTGGRDLSTIPGFTPYSNRWGSPSRGRCGSPGHSRPARFASSWRARPHSRIDGIDRARCPSWDTPCECGWAPGLSGRGKSRLEPVRMPMQSRIFDPDGSPRPCVRCNPFGRPVNLLHSWEATNEFGGRRLRAVRREQKATDVVNMIDYISIAAPGSILVAGWLLLAGRR